MSYATHDHTDARRRFDTIRVLLAVPAAVLAGVMVEEMTVGLFGVLRELIALDTSRMVSVFVGAFGGWLGPAICGGLVTFLAGPRARYFFPIWGFLMVVGMCLTEHIGKDPWLKYDFVLLGFLIKMYFAVAGSAVVGCWYFLRASQAGFPASIAQNVSTASLSVVAFLAGAAIWGLCRLFVYGSDGGPLDGTATILAFGGSLILIAWAGFLLSCAGGARRIRFFLLWPVLITMGAGIPVLIECFVAVGVSADTLSAAGTMLGLLGMFTSTFAFIGSALPSMWLGKWEAINIVWPEIRSKSSK